MNAPRYAIYVLLGLLSLVNFQARAQEVFHHVSNISVYDFLDEMANGQFIDLSSAAKPYSRQFIALKLQEIETQRDLLNQRQRNDLDFFLRDFNKEIKPDKNFNKRFDLFYYKDSLFTFSVNPILGVQYWTNENGSATHWWNGAEAFSYLGKHFGFYASLRDNHDREFLSDPDYLNQRMGAPYKGNGDFSEFRGGITYAWKWGSFGLIKDHFAWGNNYHGANLFSGRTPSFAQIYLTMKPVHWFEFRYVHGWLISEVVDSTRSYWYTSSYGPQYREVFHPKYMAANLFTFRPWKRLNVSFGNSIVYADLGVFPGYLVPLAFFKSIDHTTSEGIDNQNSQLFFDISSRQIKNLHLYATWFIDELSTRNMFNKDRHSNFWSFKLGGRLSNYPLKNISITTEYTRSHPLTFQHPVPTLEFASNQYGLGHYLKDNAHEFFLSLDSKPIRGLWIHASYLFIQKGPDYDSQGGSRLGLPFLETVEWENKTFILKVRYEIINDGVAFLEYRHSSISGNVDTYTHPLWHGDTNTFSFGVHFGL
jgi:hypothetical protein